MSFVLVLATDPDAPALTAALAEAARDAVAGTSPVWLAADTACDIALPDGPGESRTIEASARSSLGGAPVDVAVVPAARRRKRLLVADMDSTIIGQECIDELADVVGIKPHIAEITERAMRGELEFEPALRERVALLEGMDVGAVERVLAERITLNPGARALVATMRANGAYTALVSGGFTMFTSRIADLAGFHENRANELIVDGGRLTGLVAEPILGREAKRRRLEELRSELRLDSRDTLAVGDGANDLSMLEAAGLGVAFRAKPAVAEMAGARIDHAGLTGLLFLQGYRSDEFIV